MGLRWIKEEYKAPGEVGSSQVINALHGTKKDYLLKTLEEVQKEPVRKYVERFKKYCTERSIAETHSRGKKFDKIENTIHYRVIKDVLPSLKVKFSDGFGVKEVITELGAANFTDGSLQRKILNSMVCLGLVKKEIIEYETKKGIRRKDLFSVNDVITPCTFLQKGKCSFNWKEAEQIDYAEDETNE